MGKPRWYSKGREVSSADIAFALAEKRAEKKKRARVLREQMQARFKAEADHRKVGAAIRRAVREQERQFRKTIRAAVQPLPGRDSKSRDRQFEALLGLTFTRASVKRGDGLSSFHFKVRSRGFGERRQNRAHIFRAGETVKCLRYIVRAAAREIPEGGLVSNISDDPELLAGFFQAIEDFERNDRSNAMVYMSAVISLPHELTSSEREQVLRDICAILARHDLGHVGVLHAPDAEGDQRNFHAHLLFSMRPIEVRGMGAFAFSAEKHSDLNDASFIGQMREEIAAILNRSMASAGHSRRFTHLSKAARGLPAMTKAEGKSGPGKKAFERKKRDLALMRAERDYMASLRSEFARLLALTGRIASWPVRDFVQEANHLARKERVRIDRQVPSRSVASIAKGPRAPSDGLPTYPYVMPDHRQDPARMQTISDLVARLGAERHLPLIQGDPSVDGGAPRYRLEPLDRFDRRSDLFNAVAPFEDDDQIQTAFAAARRQSIDTAETMITRGRNTPLAPDQDLFMKDFGARDEYLQRAIALMLQDADFVAMIERVRLFWTEWRARERRQKAELTSLPVSSVMEPPTEAMECQVLRPQHHEYPTKRPDGAER
ncbi:MobA/MobL family protein [Sphingomonas koreensis]|uniref:MobA/MobL family protein n=2 Tax=Sphingomonas koreensis TaxID=93064 RepID=UPI000CAA192A|nr:MobA/MobL family protein [Sphingomonas koreensis]PJI87956.1 MobA/MobL family protein [Sphingomonas koreensis]